MRTWLIVSVVFVLAALSFAQIPASNHVVMVVEENHGYSSVMNKSTMPYLNSLASKYGLATQYYANTHPAIGNYMQMTTGQALTKNDTLTPAQFPVSEDNIVRQMLLAGKTWKSYAEGLPYAGYTGGNTGNYAVKNNPFAYFAEVQNSDIQKMNLVPFSQFAKDLANNQLPEFSFIVPNVLDNGQTGSLQQADAWLKQNIAPLLADSAFQQDGLLIITFEESGSADKSHGGGQVATLVIGPNVIPGYKSTNLYQHQSTLKTVLSALGATSFPGAAATAPLMSDFFATAHNLRPAEAAKASAPATTAAGVTISSPSSGATVSSPVTFVASATSSSSAYPITAMRLYVDSVSKYTVQAASMNTSQALASGAHNVTIVAWDKSGKSYNKSITINVGTATASGSVTVASPANGATVGSPMQVVASAQAPSGRTITAMQVYVDNVSVYSVKAASINTSLSVTSGAHYVVVQAWDSTGAVYKTPRNITVSGSSTSAGALTVNPGSLSFGTVSVGTSTSQTLTVTAGTSPVTISQANATASFTVTGLSLPKVIAAGQSASFSVSFAPTASGTVNGSLSLVSNASNSTATVALGGTGAVASGTTHSVVLNWSDSSSGLTGFNIYRSTQSGGSYSKLTSSPVSAMTYTDSTVSASTSYYYMVTAVNTSGTESADSTPIEATVPAN